MHGCYIMHSATKHSFLPYLILVLMDCTPVCDVLYMVLFSTFSVKPTFRNPSFDHICDKQNKCLVDFISTHRPPPEQSQQKFSIFFKVQTCLNFVVEKNLSISKNCAFIDLIETWLPFNYSFICLVYVSAIQNNLWFITRLVRLRFKLDGSHFSNKPIQGQPEMWLSAFLKLYSKSNLMYRCMHAIRCSLSSKVAMCGIQPP